MHRLHRRLPPSKSFASEAAQDEHGPRRANDLAKTPLRSSFL